MLSTFFRKAPLQDGLPVGLQDVIHAVAQSADKRECLEQTCALLARRYKGYRLKTYTHLHELFRKDTNYFWNKKDDFVHCTTMNYLVRLVLIKSEFFCEEDISQHWTMVWYVSPHQYLRVDLGEETLAVDLWGVHNGVPLGCYASGFGVKKIVPIVNS